MHKIALLFPGQGSQKPGMGKSFFDASIAAREIFHRVDDALDFSLSNIMFNGPSEVLTQTHIAQPAILTHSVAAVAALNSVTDLSYDFLCGHSLGEFSALVVANVLTLEDAVKLVYFRGQAMQRAVALGQGAMAAIVGLDAQTIVKICAEISQNNEEYVVAANFNGDAQTVISGTAAGVSKASAQLKEKGAKLVIALNVSAPFHCALMKNAQDELQNYMQSIKFKDADCPIVSNVSARPMQKSAEIKELMIKQVTSPVQFTQMLNYLIGSDTNTFLEIGPGKALAGIIKRTQKNCRMINIENEQDLDVAIQMLS